MKKTINALGKSKKMKNDEMDKAYALKIKEGEMTVLNTENKLAKENMKLPERKTYLLDKESNINKREHMLQKIQKDVENIERKKN